MKGVGEDYKLYSNLGFYSEWEDLIPKLLEQEINTVRLAFSIDPGNSYSHTVLDYDDLDDILDLLDEHGLYAILDLHNRHDGVVKDHQGYFGSPRWQADMVSLGNRYKDRDTVIALQPFNEAFRITHYETHASGSLELFRFVQKAYAELTDELRHIGFMKPVIDSDYDVYENWGWETIGEYIRDGLYHSCHIWASPWAVDSTHTTGPGIEGWWNRIRGKMEIMLTFPEPKIVIDEFGPWHDPRSNWDMEEQADFCVKILNWGYDNGIGWNMWMYERSTRPGHDYHDYYNQALDESIYGQENGGETMTTKIKNIGNTPLTVSYTTVVTEVIAPGEEKTFPTDELEITNS